MAVAVDGQEVPLTRRRERACSPCSWQPTAHRWPPSDSSPRSGATRRPVRRSPRCRSRSRGCARSSSPTARHAKGSRLVSTAAGYSLVADVRRCRHLDLRVARERRPGRERARPRGYGWRTRRGHSGRRSPYADRDAPAVLSETNRLQELLLTLEELRARALLDLGSPQALRSLAELAPQHPYRERMWSLLALAQYQCSRQADALDTLRRLRERLADELGVDPSEEIQRPGDSPCSVRTPRGSGIHAAPPRLRHSAPPSCPSRGPPRARPAPWAASRCWPQALAVVQQATATGTPRFLLLAGEPGIGKSRLIGRPPRCRIDAGCGHADRPVPRGRLRPRPGRWSLSAVRPAIAGEDPDPLLAPLLDEDRHLPTAEGSGDGPADVRRGRPPRRAGGGDPPSPAAGPRGHPLGRRFVTAAAAAPGGVGPARRLLRSCVRGVRPRPPAVRRPGRHDGGAGPGRGRAGPARRRSTTGSVGALLDRVGRHARRPARTRSSRR